MLELLRRSPELPRLFLAHSVSRAGDACITVAMVLLVFRLTGSGIGVAGAVFVVSALLLVGLRAGRTPADLVVRGWAGVLGGVRAVRGDPVLSRLAVVQVLATLSAGPRAA